MKRWIAIAVIAVLPAAAEQFHYRAQWRLFDAGRATIAFGGSQASLRLATQGTVGKLHHVDDQYEASYSNNLCAAETTMRAEEGAKRLETVVSFHEGKARRVEKNLVSGEVKASELEVPGCVHDIVASLAKLRSLDLMPGATTRIPLSDGRKFIEARVDAKAIEKVKTPGGEFEAVRYEAHLFNGAFYRRKGRLFIWISNDERRVPVQIQVELPFYIGDVTLRLDSAPAAEQAFLRR